MSVTNIPGQSAGIYTQTSVGDEVIIDGVPKGTGDKVTNLDTKQYVNAGNNAGNTGNDEVPEPPPVGSKQVFSTSQAMVGMGEKDVLADMYAVMAMFQKMAQEMRNSAREVRQTEMQSQVGALKSAAQEIRNAAQERLQGAIVAGAMQIVGGAMSVGMGVVGGAMQIKAGAKTIESGKLMGDAQNVAAKNPTMDPVKVLETSEGMRASAKVADGVASQLSGRGAQFTAIGQGSMGVFGGIGTIVQATQEVKAAGHDAKRSELEADAKVHESGVQHANDLMQQMMDVIRDVRDKLGSIEQSRLETNRGIARNI